MRRSIRVGQRVLTGDWAHLAGVTAGAAYCVWYMYDTWRASSDIENVGFIIPAGLLALALYGYVVARDIRVTAVAAAKPEMSGPRAAPSIEGWRTPTFMALMGVFIIGMSYVGFDVSSVAFIGVSLAVLGERRWLLLAAYSTVFGLGVTYFFKSMLSLPIPTLVLP